MRSQGIPLTKGIATWSSADLSEKASAVTPPWGATIFYDIFLERQFVGERGTGLFVDV